MLSVACPPWAAGQVWQAFGLALLFVPINTVSYVGLPEEKGGRLDVFLI
jgi:hypothetical protein